MRKKSLLCLFGYFWQGFDINCLENREIVSSTLFHVGIELHYYWICFASVPKILVVLKVTFTVCNKFCGYILECVLLYLETFTCSFKV